MDIAPPARIRGPWLTQWSHDRTRIRCQHHAWRPPAVHPALALLLDVDGPVASPVTRDVKAGIIADLVALATAGIPVIFNTGRSDTFIREHVMEPMIAAGIPAGTVIHAVCEKGAVWFSYTAAGPAHPR
ncbi:hypothetical protein AHiyo4_06300 [Arthrobacter sp. Hiyo4]|nr:hypothetical protein AHiyo4_06300 [Arthrobacter sp. Hiyo4]